MKAKFTLLFLSAFFFTLSSQAQVFVKHDASGANDGSSWADAFTDLEEALNSSSEGDQIWVAAGTYKPGGNSPSIESFFTFPHDLELYGGFAGTESMLSERDWEANETILSGDHNDDDVDDNFTTNRTDNSKHVMWLTDTVTTASIIDGLTFRNGHTLDGSASGNDRRAGGLLTYGAPAIRNCYFTQNYGWFGGGLYPRGGTAGGVIIESCTFEKNNGQFGAGMYLNSSTATVSECDFFDNTSVSLGGGFYNNSAQGTMITDCVFEGNISQESRGGGLYNTTSPSTISNCQFTENSAGASSGGGMQVRHTDDAAPAIEVNVMDCTFEGNIATFGGGFGSYDRLSIVNISNCTFEENSSGNVGGAISNAFGANTNITGCSFTENESGTGGAIYSQNDSSRVNITESIFTINSAEIGGAVAMSGSNEPTSTVPLPTLNIDRSFLLFNIALDQAGGVNMSNGELRIENTLIDNNIVENGGGGAVSINTSDSIRAEHLIINSTFTLNIADIGAGISHWKPGPEAVSNLTLQNTILHNPSGNNYEIEDGDPALTSNGGNLSADESAVDYLVGPNDLNNTDPLFIDFDGEDYRLQGGSPCIDAGIADGAPSTDIEGVERMGTPDMGAYEFQIIENLFEAPLEFGNLSLFPNPAIRDLNFSFESTWRGEVSVRIVNMEGKVVFSEKLEKNERLLSGQYHIEDLPGGQYELVISAGGEKFINAQSFVK